MNISYNQWIIPQNSHSVQQSYVYFLSHLFLLLSNNSATIPAEMRKQVFFHVGNICMLLAALGMIYTFLPLVQIYVFPPAALPQSETKNGFSISIPRIHAYAPVLPNIDPWNEFEYKEALKHGVAHAKGTALPGQKGTIYLFAHSSGAPWEVTHYNTIFLRLGELEKNDVITLEYNKNKSIYSVLTKKEVWPTEVTYITSTTDEQLILQTCTPIGTSLKRLLIFAKRTN
jgi:LPXTG-site transpeptidase (sortase) family protein